ncbi:MAG: 50S ribosomal protein L6 [Alphaproteobacteria bacterium]|nr:50S ribosomal protein L6 [Alphaproteobacteria bacterium]
MSRIGKAPINLPEGVMVNFNDNLVDVSGKCGKLSFQIPEEVKVEKRENTIVVTPADGSNRARAMWGLSRSLINNQVQGVSEGFEKKLEIVGVGYKAAVDGKFLTLNLGYSHEIKFLIPEGIAIKAIKPTLLSVSGCDKQKVGQVAAIIVKQRPPEPYKGKGIKYEGQVILRKEGKKK